MKALYSIPRYFLTVQFAGVLLIGIFGFKNSIASTESDVVAIPSFNNISVYWVARNLSSSDVVSVKYRKLNTLEWNNGLDIPYQPIEGTDLERASYRGSIVGLESNTAYEILLQSRNSEEQRQIQVKTRSDNPPIGQIIAVKSKGKTINITQSGDPSGYILYDFSGHVMDAKNQVKHNVAIDASYVILRGLRAVGARSHAIDIDNGSYIFIENCDISGWGKPGTDSDRFGLDSQAAIYSNNPSVSHITIQNCNIHSPRFDSNSWEEKRCYENNRCSNHPAGPQAVVFRDTAGGHVIRHNKFWSDSEHYFNDILGSGRNDSYSGFPGPDSDIHNNYLANCWDDGIEAEGGGRNVRIYENYIENCFNAIANAPVSIGPMYIWRNVSAKCHSITNSENQKKLGSFLKAGFAGHEGWMTGRVYLFHNTIYTQGNIGCAGVGNIARLIKNTVSSNNIFHVPNSITHSVSGNSEHDGIEFDNDLANGTYPSNPLFLALIGTPIYTDDAGFDPESATGHFTQTENSPGFDSGLIVNNFSLPFNGEAPDMGAHESGETPLVYGPRSSNTSQ